MPDISDEITRLTATARELGAQMRDASATDNARWQSVKAELAELRHPSKAHLIGPGIPATGDADLDHYFVTLAKANSPRLAGSYSAMDAAKAKLDEWGSVWSDPDPAAKATVGDTDAAGGYLVPGAVVGAINEQATARRSVVDLFDVVNGVRGSAVDVPFENDSTSRAVIALPGATKENSDFVTGAYNATLYTLARIFDVGNQLLRHSGGAAERNVRSRLARAFGLGEDYYALQGSGTNQPYGLLTALGTSGPHVTTFSSPADNTVAGSVIAAVLTAAGELADLGAEPDGVVLNSGDFYRMARQGSDNAGFWRDPFTPLQSAGTDGRGPGGLRWRHSPNMPTDSLVVGEFGSTAFYRGEGYRVDTSSEAGDRWDKNLTGFRGEEEIAFDARPAVYARKFKRIVNAVGA